MSSQGDRCIVALTTKISQISYRPNLLQYGLCHEMGQNQSISLARHSITLKNFVGGSIINESINMMYHNIWSCGWL
jgi:hypothetical protein